MSDDFKPTPEDAARLAAELRNIGLLVTAECVGMLGAEIDRLRAELDAEKRLAVVLWEECWAWRRDGGFHASHVQRGTFTDEFCKACIARAATDAARKGRGQSSETRQQRRGKQRKERGA